MTELSQENTAAIVEHCRGSAEAFSTSLTTCFGHDFRVQPAETDVWSPQWDGACLEQAGLSLRLQLGGQLILCLIPESAGLPAWYAASNETQQLQILSLAQEWSQQVLPEDLTADDVDWLVVDNLSQLVAAGNPGPETQIIAWSSADSESTSALHMVVGVSHAVEPEVESQQLADVEHTGPQKALLRIPVTVSVRLAQKRIEMGQVLEIAPGALITFDKPCDEPLDMYVNNHKFCRGEAVKVGDKFGLKIDVIGRFEAEPERVISH